MFGILNDLQAPIEEEEELEERHLEDEMPMNVGVDIDEDRTNIFQNLLNEARNELYPGCSEFSSLNFLVKLMHVKVLNGWSNKSFDMLLELLRAAFPMCSTILSLVHFLKQNENFVTWAWDTRLFKRASVTVYCIGKSLLICNIVLHVARLGTRDKRVETDDVLRHPADAEGWKHFDSEYPNFAFNPRNGGVQRSIRHVLYAWVIDRPSRYEVEYLSWDIDVIFQRTTCDVEIGYTMERNHASGRPRKRPVAQASNAAREATMESEEFDAEFSRPHVEGNVEEQLLDKLAQRLVSEIRSTQLDPEKKYEIERLKGLVLWSNEMPEGSTGDKSWDEFYPGFFRDVKCTCADWNDFSKLVEAALRVEKSLNKRKHEREASKNVRTFSSSMHRNRLESGKSSVCYNCGQLGHYRRNCPHLISKGNTMMKTTSQTVSQQPRTTRTSGKDSSGEKQKGPVCRSRQKGKIFAMTQHEAIDTPNGRTTKSSSNVKMEMRACYRGLFIWTTPHNEWGNWDAHLSLMEFAYNNNFHSSIGMTPYEALYGRRCRTPVCWDEVGERKLVEPELVQTTSENVKIIREKLKTAQDRQKSYVDKRRRDLEFEVGDKIFLKLSPWKGVLRFGRKGKLSPRFIGPYEILEHPSHILEAQPVHLKENLSYEEEPIQILDKKEQVLRNKVIPLVKVFWRNHNTEEATWETEQGMKARYPHLFTSSP
ncbi:DNA/RNA polymerases superfamily protein [Cucumis melo var. makuwa]|uniref:DNA/RNA polymerases superfamily protein n=1 Tax=Cucumis melo var. makuwa TaxID=1194695 RepID=A0A5A7VHN9_CUCMM|nr:DNA/RNA polymerases superfamily protein [Cucumis melo var. makuwa]